MAATTTVTALELSDLCRQQTEILTLLRNKGIADTLDLAEVTEYDIRQLPIKDLVVRRRLLRFIQYASQPLPALSTLEELCRQHTRTLNVLHKAGIHNLDDLQELEPEDLGELEITHIPVLRRIHKYMAQFTTQPPPPPLTLPPRKPRHLRKTSSFRIVEEPRSPSLRLRTRATSPPRN